VCNLLTGFGNVVKNLDGVVIFVNVFFSLNVDVFHQFLPRAVFFLLLTRKDVFLTSPVS